MEIKGLASKYSLIASRDVAVLKEIEETDCDFYHLLADVVENCFVVKLAALSSAWTQEQVEFSEGRMVDVVNASRRWQPLVT